MQHNYKYTKDNHPYIAHCVHNVNFMTFIMISNKIQFKYGTVYNFSERPHTPFPPLITALHNDIAIYYISKCILT